MSIEMQAQQLAQQLQRPHLAALVPYASARRSMSGGSIWLNANEAPDGELNRYPSFQPAAMLEAYARYAKVAAQQVLTARGSDEVIDVLIRTFCEPGQDKIMICPPTYGMYAISAQTHGAEVVTVPLLPDLTLALDDIAAQLKRVKLIFLCHPSNPLGNPLPSAQIEAVLQAAENRALVVVDEAYIEYAQAAGIESTAAWLTRYPNLVVLRTLSKAFGLAAIRCGFALANEAIIQTLQKVLAPYPVPLLTEQTATQQLAPAALQTVQQRVMRTTQLREALIATLQAQTWVTRVFPSVTNFVLCQVDDAAKRVAWFQRQGILIRNQSAQLNLPQSIRISIGSAAEMAAVAELLAQEMPA